MLYFAYGANTNLDSMNYRCPDASLIGAIKLPDWRLVFKSVADIEQAPYNEVHGVLWKITDACEASLDIFEGYPNLYRKEFFSVKIEVDGEERIEDVMFYKMNRMGYDLPSQYYFDLIKEGYIQNDINTKHLHNALESNI